MNPVQRASCWPIRCLVPGAQGLLLLLLTGCATFDRHGLAPSDAAQVAAQIQPAAALLTPELSQRILRLDPDNVTEEQVRTVLSHAPAPRIINIHGGITPVQLRMVSFSKFLAGMGYPERSLTNPVDGTYSFSCYESSKMIAGMIAWYYEREGLRPMIVGHSQGGIQAVKVLHLFARPADCTLNVWNPLTWQKESRREILDPLTCSNRPVVGLQLPYVTAVGAGGLTRFLPNQWDMIGRLREIPDSVEEFTGFYKALDPLGGDSLGWGQFNLSQPLGSARVRMMKLPSWYKHGSIPDTEHLLKNPQAIQWINDYQPPLEYLTKPKPKEGVESIPSILWAAEVWHSLKKHWVKELQHVIQANLEGAPSTISAGGSGSSGSLGSAPVPAGIRSKP